MKKMVVIAMVAVMGIATLTGCGTQKEEINTVSTETVVETETAESTTPQADEEEAFRNEAFDYGKKIALKYGGTADDVDLVPTENGYTILLTDVGDYGTIDITYEKGVSGRTMISGFAFGFDGTNYTLENDILVADEWQYNEEVEPYVEDTTTTENTDTITNKDGVDIPVDSIVAYAQATTIMEDAGLIAEGCAGYMVGYPNADAIVIGYYGYSESDNYIIAFIKDGEIVAKASVVNGEMTDIDITNQTAFDAIME